LPSRKHLRIVMEFVENEIALRGSVEMFAIENVAIGLVQVFHTLDLSEWTQTEHTPEGDCFSSLNSGIFVAAGEGGTAGGVGSGRLGDDVTEGEVFRVGRHSRRAGVVIVAGDIRLVLLAVAVGAFIQPKLVPP